jgi:ATP-dependent Clp protease ATP-binding subunit ClpA
MFERFTNQSRYAIVAAQEEARSLNHSHIGSEHLLLGLLREDQGTAAPPLASAGITLEAARQVIDELVGRGERPPPGHIPFTKPAKQCLELALREALQLGHRYIGTGHLLLGLLRTGDGVGVQILERLGADLGQLRDRVTAELENDPEAGESPDEPTLARPSRQGDPIQRLLNTIDNRLSSIEGHLGIARAEPAARPAGGSPEASGLAAAAEIGRLNAEVIRLKALLREHDIDPNESGTPGAATA